MSQYWKSQQNDLVWITGDEPRPSFCIPAIKITKEEYEEFKRTHPTNDEGRTIRKRDPNAPKRKAMTPEEKKAARAARRAARKARREG